MPELAATRVHDPVSLGESTAPPEGCPSTLAPSRPKATGFALVRLPNLAATSASMAVFLAALPVVIPSGCSPGPEWVAGLDSPGVLAVALCVVLLSFALGFRRPPLMPQALLHLGLMAVLFGAATHVLHRHQGTLALESGQAINRYESTAGPRLLPFALQLHRRPTARPETSSAPAEIVPAKLASLARSGNPPYPGRLLVQWPARALSVRLPVQVGDAPLLVPPGEKPASTNAFRIAFVRLVPDFVMDPATHEVSARSDEPSNPALLVRETGPGYTLERWLFAKFPELARHQEAAHAARTSPLRLRYETDASDRPSPTESVASSAESEPEVLAAWTRSARNEAGASAAPSQSMTAGGRLPSESSLGDPIIVCVVNRGSPCLTNQLDARRPLCFGGYRLRPAAPDPRRPGLALIEVERPRGGGWVSSGAGLAVFASLFTRRSLRRRGDEPVA